MPPDTTLTPAMRQWKRCKDAHPDCVLLFRMGDFYELFYEDAVAASRALGLTLTERTAGVPMAGVPFHQLENYLRRFLAEGFRVAVADQLEDPREAKGIVDRGVVRVVSSGTLVDESLLDAGAPNRVAAAWVEGAGPGAAAGVASVELSTGHFVVRTVSGSSLGDELARVGARELLYSDYQEGRVPEAIAEASAVSGATPTPRPPWQFRADEAETALRERFGVATLEPFGLDASDPALRAAGALVRFLEHTQLPDGPKRAGIAGQRASLAHLSMPRREGPDGECVIDSSTLRALEVERTIRGGQSSGSLLGLFAGRSSCRTAMGRRLLRDWLCRPLSDRGAIEARHGVVSTLVSDRRMAEELGGWLERVQDVARIAGRLALDRATPRDVVALGSSLGAAGPLSELCRSAPALAAIAEEMEGLRPLLDPLGERIASTCVDTPPLHLREGGLVRDGVDAELDRARLLQRDAGAWLAEYQGRVAAEVGMPQLRVGFNKVFGYYVELTAAQARQHDAALTRAGFVRKQTLRNGERYITDELKRFEDEVMGAEARAVEREQAIFEQLCEAARGRLREIGAFADAAARLDVLWAFASKAEERGWVRPELQEEPVLELHHARHPVLDESLGRDFVPNDVELGGGRATLALLTGPNMAGKSTYIRQVALVVLLAHAGSFVPADRAVIGVCDRVLARVGADDALHRGQSTFMVEMTETASILHHASERSLVVLDEIGRGTSTLDGLALAWAIAERLAEGAAAREGASAPRGGAADGDEARDGGSARSRGATRGPLTLFATHYHELTDLAERMPDRVVNLRVAVREWTRPTDEGPRPEVVFLHRIEPGRADGSYGIHVAQLAGVPREVTARAREVLATLAVHSSVIERSAGADGSGCGDGSGRGREEGRAVRREEGRAAGQLPLFREFVPHPAVDRLREVKLESLTPLGAFDVLRELRELARGGERPDGVGEGDRG